MLKNYFYLVLAIVFTVNAMAQNIPSYMPTNGLVGYWPFNGNANDESGNGKNGTVNGATLSDDRNGKVNSAYNINPNSNILLNQKIFNDKFSISFWFYANNNQSDAVIFDFRGINTINKNIDNYETLDFTFFDSKTLRLRSRDSIDLAIQSNNLPYNLTINQWNSVQIIYDNFIYKVFINSKLVSEIANAEIKFDYLTYLNFGNDYKDPNHYFNGQIDDIAIYNRALTQQEITALYTSTPVAQNIPSYVPKDGLVGYWPFNGNANDESGKGNNGTVNGATLTADRNGKSNSAYSFDGQSNFIEISDPVKTSLDFLGNDFSVSAWVNTKSNQLDGPIVTKQNLGIIANESGDYNMNIIKGQGRFAMGMGNGDGAQRFSNSFINNGNWHNVIAIYRKNNIELYVDGILENGFYGGPNEYPNSLSNSNESLNFGRGWIYHYDGQLDDIAIYNRALSQQEITALYSGSTNLASTKVFVDAPASVNQNDTLELSISTETLNSSDNVIAFQTDITYDTTRYTFVSNNTVGTLNTKASVDLNTDKKGTIKVGYISTSALQGAGSLLKLKFKANQKVGQGIFSLSQFMYNNTDITSLKNDTVLTLDVTPPSATISLSQNPVRKGDSLLITVKFSETMTDKPAPQVNLSGANTLASSNLTKVNETTYTYWWVVEKGNGAVNVEITSAKDLAGNNLSKATSNTSFTLLPTLFGDIDTNKFIRAYDAALALQYSVGLNPLPTMDPLPWSNWRIAVANVDTVGNITANDASLILQKSIDKIASFPADAKKRGGEAPVANITVTQEGNQLVFRATGTLYAFNVFMKDNFNAFGQPEVKDKNAMIATNINSTTYNVGLASTTPFVENEPFLILPILTNDNLQGTMDIVANAQEKALAYGKAASIATIQNDVMVVYPNPTKDVVTINNAQGKTLRIIDFQGRLVNTQIVTSNAHEVSLKAIATKGEYIFQLIGENNETITSQKVVMQ